MRDDEFVFLQEMLHRIADFDIQGKSPADIVHLLVRETTGRLAEPQLQLVRHSFRGYFNDAFGTDIERE